MLNVINTWASTKGHSGVFTGGRLRSSHQFRLFFGGDMEVVSGTALQLLFNQQGEGLCNGGFLTLAVWSPRRSDSQVGQASLNPSCVTPS